MPPLMRRIFWFLNKYFMVPMMRLGFGPLFGNPFTGYIMVLKAIGRKSGKIRYAPVNYAIHKGNIYCISGGRESSDWYRNVRATPEIEIILPGGPIFGRVEEVIGDDERRMVIRQILQNAGFAGFFEGYNPFTITDDELMKKSADLPVLRIRPLGLGNGASDPAGWAWIWLWVLTLVLILWIVLK
jgi:deazaflavin-dependent oxidoreductase (nitroreductase family)